MLPTIPGRTELLGNMPDLTCPCCLASDIWLFRDIDMKDLRLRCSHCGFELRYMMADTLREFWKDLMNVSIRLP